MLPKMLKEDDNDNLSVSSQSMSDFGASKTSAPSSSNRTSFESEQSQPELARNEETRRLIRSSKALVLITILAATAACGAATYIFISRGEEAAFHGQVSQNKWCQPIA